MFDIGWSELLVIAVVALIAIGPKELPGVLRTAGQWIGKVRRMAAEFQSQFQEALREAEMDDLKKQVDDLKAAADDIRPITTRSSTFTTSSQTSIRPLRTIIARLKRSTAAPAPSEPDIAATTEEPAAAPAAEAAQPPAPSEPQVPPQHSAVDTASDHERSAPKTAAEGLSS